MKNVNKYIMLFFVLLGISKTIQAQTAVVNRAISYQQAGDLDKAKAAIDSAVINPTTANDPYAWYVKGYIYKTLYTKREAGKRKLDIRKEALAAFVKSKQIDLKGENTDDNNKNIKFIATTYYNDAVQSLDSVNYSFAIEAFDLYKKAIIISEPATDITKKDVDFDLALASMYTKTYENNRKGRADFFGKAKDAYNRVIGLDANNISANYNLGILYYNQAVSIINAMDYDLDLITLNQIQDDCVVLFKQSLPFMEKAYQLDPKRKETLIGLSGIYFSLNEEEKSKEIKLKIDAIEQNK